MSQPFWSSSSVLECGLRNCVIHSFLLTISRLIIVLLNCFQILNNTSEHRPTKYFNQRGQILNRKCSAVAPAFNGDLASQWEKASFDPNRIDSKNVTGDYVGDPYTCAKFGENPSRKLLSK